MDPLSIPNKISNIFYDEEITKEKFEGEVLRDQPLTAIMLIKFQVSHFMLTENDN